MEIKQYIEQQLTKITAEKAWEYFDNKDIPFTQGTFINKYCKIHTQIRNNINTLPTPLRAKKNTSAIPNNQSLTTAIQSIKAVVTQLGTKTDEQSTQTRQTLLSAIACVDDGDKITNKDVIKYIYPSCNTRLYNQIVSNKKAFNNSNTKLLYNINTCGNKRKRKVYSDQVDKHITNWWISNTCADPNTYKFRKLRDHNGNKYKTLIVINIFHLYFLIGNQ